MALPATDVFTSASDQALTTYSASWTNNSGAFQVVGATDDVMANSSGNECGAHWNADSFNNNQYAQAKVTARSASGVVGAAVRCHASAATYYGYYTDSGASYLFKMVAGSWTQLGSNAAALAVNDIIRIEANGTTITPKKNGSTTGTPGAQTDSAIASGYAGLSGYGNQTTARVDNFEGGNLAAPVTVVFRRSRSLLGTRAGSRQAPGG